MRRWKFDSEEKLILREADASCRLYKTCGSKNQSLNRCRKSEMTTENPLRITTIKRSISKLSNVSVKIFSFIIALQKIFLDEYFYAFLQRNKQNYRLHGRRDFYVALMTLHTLMITTDGLNRLARSWSVSAISSWCRSCFRIFIIRTIVAWINNLRSSSITLFVWSSSCFCSARIGKFRLIFSFLLLKTND